MTDMNSIRGAGGGKKKGESRTPIEAPDSLRSTAFARILDLVGEGEIVGPANALKPLTCVFLNETPVEAVDGTLNFKNVQIEFRSGTQTQDYIKGFVSTENEIGVNIELRSDQSWTQALSNRNIDAVRIRLSVQALSKTDTTNGDTSGHTVEYAIDLATDGGGFVEKFKSAFTGKTSSKYERTHRLDLPRATTGWTVRVRRLTLNTTSQAIADTTSVESFTEIVDAKLRYPMSAYFGIVVDAEQFQSIPSRAFRLKGRIIKVPSNYNAVTRVYTGIWDGTFQVAYTNNPAWVFYDMATSTRYGMGHRIPAALIDKWALYKIAQYCDQLVPDGFGGMEPRFTINIFLQSQQDATKVLQDLTTAFRGMMYVAGGSIFAVGDMPEDPVFVYTPSNVMEGGFSYSGTARRARHTVALVSWSDMSNFGRAKVEYVEDEDGIIRYGLNQTEVIALGCTSRGQAHRMGKYILTTERYETDVVSFTVGLDGTIVAPGKIIKIVDPLRAGKRMGGRIRAVTANSITVDLLPVGIAAGHTLTVHTPSGVAVTRIILTVAGDVLTVTVPFTELPLNQSVWAVETPTLNAQRYRVLSVREGDTPSTYSIAALRHIEGKYAFVENNVKIEEPPIAELLAVPGPPVNAMLVYSQRYAHGIAHNYIEARWDHMQNAAGFGIQWRKDEGAWSEVIQVRDPTDFWEGAFAGKYIARIWGLTTNGIAGPSVITNPVVIDDAVLPIKNLEPAGGILEIDCRFAQFRLLLTQNVTQVIYSNVAPQDTILIEVTMGGAGNHTINFGNSVVPIDGVAYVPTAVLKATDVLGLTTTNTGATWRMAVQKAFGGGEPLTVSIAPDPATATANSLDGASVSPSKMVTATVLGSPGPYTVSWSRTDASPNSNFLLTGGTTLTPTFSMAAGNTYAYHAQTWAVLVTDTVTGLSAQSAVNVILERTTSATGGGGGPPAPTGFSVSISGTGYGFCSATPEVGCTPETVVEAMPVNGVAPYTYVWSRLDNNGTGEFVNGGKTDKSLYLALQSSGTFNVTREQTWGVTVTDATGATRSDSILITLERSNGA